VTIRVLSIGCAAAFTALMSGGGTPAARVVGIQAPAVLTGASTVDGASHVDHRLCGDPGGGPAGGTGGDAGGDGGGGGGGDAG
jgi:hypothetical protein